MAGGTGRVAVMGLVELTMMVLSWMYGLDDLAAAPARPGPGPAARAGHGHEAEPGQPCPDFRADCYGSRTRSRAPAGPAAPAARHDRRAGRRHHLAHPTPAAA